MYGDASLVTRHSSLFPYPFRDPFCCMAEAASVSNFISSLRSWSFFQLLRSLQTQNCFLGMFTYYYPKCYGLRNWYPTIIGLTWATDLRTNSDHSHPVPFLILRCLASSPHNLGEAIITVVSSGCASILVQKGS
jgi:hypothetical protein